ncbi:S8 family serine peptidase [Neobacillus sp. YIM B02564]|uniref:S8 family serine peptidase n=1 Tax=Neobacillus paridis TaxID=2803862 RepID=A0ABS1TTM6_9BACI|nr:S8 family serine peptidase [Neobacillus paridis]MBL4954089.1 S8 family serine peptidase [Neobacillus paridis]
MKSIWKKISTIGIGAVLMTSTIFTSTAQVTAAGKQGMNKSAIQKKLAPIKQKIKESKASLLSDDTLIIKYKQPINQGEVKGVNKDFIITQNVKQLGYIVVKLLKKNNLQKVTQAFQKNSKVLSVERSVMYKTFSVPADPKVNDEYHLSMLNIAKAQQLAGKKKVKVAVIDTGIDQNHPELKGKVLPAYNIINPMNHGAPDTHGTHVSGIIAAAKGNGIGGYGINPNVEILPIDVLDRDGLTLGMTFDYTVAQAVLYAASHGAKVINMSLGSPFPSTILKDAVDTAIQKGVTVVAAAGNDAEAYPNYPASYEGVIGVGAVNNKKQLSWFSSYGPSVDLVAPGEDIYAPIYDYEKKSSFETLSGTSMSSPMVAGVASLLLSKHPNLKPAQVEYILEHTAKDLGAKGYDIKYGNGLVDPVGALNYNIKNLPSFVTAKWTKKDILQKATTLSFADSKELTENFTKPSEQKWYQFPVKKGEFIQTALNGPSQYDYKMTLNIYSDDQTFSVDVNKQEAGKTEGKLIQAPFSGTMAIGISDVNGNYDESPAKRSTFRLAIQRSAEMPEDESTMEAPIEVKSLPYTSESLTFMGENGDDDYFRFKTGEETAARVTLSGVAGIDSNIQVYDLSMSNEAGQQGESGATATSSNQPNPDTLPVDQLPSVAQMDRNGIGAGEKLSFEVTPNREYLVKVSSKPMLQNESDMGMTIFDQSSEETHSSLLPYTVKIETKVLPQDEDNIGNGESGGEEGDSAYYQTILDSAIPTKIGQPIKGYIQNSGDEDWYKIEPSQTGIYQFSLANDDSDKPYVELYQVINSKDEYGKPILDFSYIGSNESDNLFTGELNGTMHTGLKKNETYLIHFTGNPMMDMGVSIDPYNLSSKLLISNPGDQYEDNDATENIKDLPASVIRGNFAMPNDIDNFYLKGNKTQIYSLLFESGKASEKMLQKYPKELFGDIYGVAIVYRDINKNRKIDEADSEMATIMIKGLFEGASNNYGSFKVEKGQNYIISIIGLTVSSTQLSLVPYQLTVAPVPTKDEDSKSKVKNNIPSKPISLKKKNSHTLYATGHLNSGIGYGDEDWYVVNVKDKLNGYISFESGNEVDGVISLYKNGKLISKADYYGAGQAEMMRVQLKKGKYHIKVKDVFGNSTIKPYTIKITN